MSSRAIVGEFSRMVAKLNAGGALSRDEQARAARFALHRARDSRMEQATELADALGPDFMRMLHDRRVSQLAFSCALLDDDCKVLCSFSGTTDLLEPAEDLLLAAITNGGTGQLHARPND